MSIPQETTVLIVGGGPGGSYTASALVREGVSCVVLEADKFPRYHVGESMLPSMRHFLRFIDLDDTFVKHGFRIKKGAAFKLNDKPVGYTDFVAHGGPGNHSWNVLREEADDLMFRHAGKCGAEIFDGVKVNSIEFEPPTKPDAKLPSGIPDPGRPVSASWSRKDGTSGQIKFDYLVDASGRAGIVSTKYLKNRKNNQGLKNIANWGYWKAAEDYAQGTERQGAPLFEALSDASGWCWYIPLHNGTTSVGVVQNQELAMAKKKAMAEPSTKGFYQESTKLAPGISQMLANAELASEIKSASDWSYNASCYATPKLRLVGDAGCFIDPYFSSGVHLALSGALSAATTIRAAMRGDCDEAAAVKWHSAKVSEGYTRFLLVVLSALKQIRQQDKPILSDWDEEGFETAFAHFRPIIQGTADVSGKLSQEEVSKTVDFCLNAFQHHNPEKQAEVMKKMETAMLVENVAAPSNLGTTKTDAEIEKKAKVDPEGLSEDELKILNTIRARQMLRREDTLSIDNFSNDAIHGYVPVVKRGSLSLMKASEKAASKVPARGQPAAEQQKAEQPAVEQPTVEQPTLELPVVEQPAAVQLQVEQLAVEQPLMEQPAVEQPTVEQPAVEQSTTEQPAVEQPAIVQPAVDQPMTDAPVIDQPATEHTVTDQPMIDQPATEHPTEDQKETDQPMSDQPTMDTPPADKYTDSLPTAISV